MYKSYPPKILVDSEKFAGLPRNLSLRNERVSQLAPQQPTKLSKICPSYRKAAPQTTLCVCSLRGQKTLEIHPLKEQTTNTPKEAKLDSKMWP